MNLVYKMILLLPRAFKYMLRWPYLLLTIHCPTVSGINAASYAGHVFLRQWVEGNREVTRQCFRMRCLTRDKECAKPSHWLLDDPIFGVGIKHLRMHFFVQLYLGKP